MEDSIGKVWDKFLTKQTCNTYHDKAVSFATKSRALKIFFHLLGGEHAKELHITDKRNIEIPRTFLEKISGSGKTFYLAWQDEKAVYLPATLAYFDSTEHNEMHYYWLIAMLSRVNISHHNFEAENQRVTQELITNYSGFKTFYEAVSQQSIIPNPLWIYPNVSSKKSYQDFEDEEEPERHHDKNDNTETLDMKKESEQIDDKRETDGLLAFLPDSLMSLMEQVNVDRSEDDSFDEDALYNAEDLDEITLGRKKANLAARIKMDLDMSHHSNEVYPLGKGSLHDEWDSKKEQYLKNYVCVKSIMIKDYEEIPLPKRLKKTVKKIQNELDLMQLDRVKRTNLPYGDEINFDSWISYKAHAKHSNNEPKFFESFEKRTRDISTLILADISLSTEAGITQEIRVIDMIQDSLMVFSEALQKLQDNFAIYAFSSLKNTDVRFHLIKNFKENYHDNIRGRINELKPGYYTRLGAAIRQSAKILEQQKSQNKLLLIISDGKPNDVDRYDGRYGIEDTKKAIDEVKKRGMTPFCITIDLEAKEYLPYLFGKNGYAVIRDGKKLPKLLPDIYINLTK
jgi:nitric oxide reductase NorD protein